MHAKNRYNHQWDRKSAATNEKTTPGTNPTTQAKQWPFSTFIVPKHRPKQPQKHPKHQNKPEKYPPTPR
jgi:hypothetical protein